MQKRDFFALWISHKHLTQLHLHICFLYNVKIFVMKKLIAEKILVIKNLCYSFCVNLTQAHFQAFHLVQHLVLAVHWVVHDMVNMLQYVQLCRNTLLYALHYSPLPTVLGVLQRWTSCNFTRNFFRVNSTISGGFILQHNKNISVLLCFGGEICRVHGICMSVIT